MDNRGKAQQQTDCETLATVTFSGECSRRFEVVSALFCQCYKLDEIIIVVKLRYFDVLEKDELFN